ADGEDGFQAVVIHVAAHAAGTFHLNYSELPNGSFRVDLTLLVDGGQVLVDRRDRDAVELGDLALGQPDGFAGQQDADAISARVDQQFAFRGGREVLAHAMSPCNRSAISPSSCRISASISGSGRGGL